MATAEKARERALLVPALIVRVVSSWYFAIARWKPELSEKLNANAFGTALTKEAARVKALATDVAIFLTGVVTPSVIAERKLKR